MQTQERRRKEGRKREGEGRKEEKGKKEVRKKGGRKAGRQAGRQADPLARLATLDGGGVGGLEGRRAMRAYLVSPVGRTNSLPTVVSQSQVGLRKAGRCSG